MQDHFIQQDFTRVIHAHGDHSQTVSNQDDVHAGMVGDVGTRKVMCSKDGDWLLPAVQALDCVDGDRLACCR